MNLTEVLRRGFRQHNYGKTYKKFFTVKDQKKYLSHFSEPIDDFERSFFQYKCQMHLEKGFSILLNLASLLLLLYYFRIKKNNVIAENHKDVISTETEKNINRFPVEVYNEFGDIYSASYIGKFFDESDRKFYSDLVKKYPASWYFQLKCLIKLQYYSFLIHTYSPKVIVTCNEYSFTSSMLTAYCEIKGIKHVDVMHGDKMFYIRDSFFRFHKMFVWNKHYIRLFEELKANQNNYVISIPESFTVDCACFSPVNDYTYYLQIDTKKQLIDLEKNLRVLKERGYSIAIRPHPIASNIELVKEIFMDYDIEDGNDISIEQSIRNTNCLISLYSTVLFQGFCSKKEIIIDDISKREVFESLREMEYIGLSLPHKLLSDVIS